MSITVQCIGNKPGMLAMGNSSGMPCAVHQTRVVMNELTCRERVETIISSWLAQMKPYRG